MAAPSPVPAGSALGQQRWFTEYPEIGSIVQDADKGEKKNDRGACTMNRPDHERRLTSPDGATLYYRCLRGTGEKALVLLHGLGSNHTRWHDFVTHTALAPEWTVIRPDLRGHAHSAWRGHLSLSDWVRDLVLILDAEKIGRAVIGGHCLGANIALHVAHDRPARSAGLVLIEPMLREALSPKLRLLAKLEYPIRGLIALVRLCNALGIKRRKLPLRDLTALDARMHKRLAAEGHDLLSRFYANPLDDLRYMPTAAYLQSLLAVIAAPPPLHAVRAPALTLLSTGGLFGDVERTRAALANMPAVTIRVLEALHWIPTEQPEQMREAIDEWCRMIEKD